MSAFRPIGTALFGMPGAAKHFGVYFTKILLSFYVELIVKHREELDNKRNGYKE